MTREDFKDIISKIVYPDVNDIIKQLEKSGLLKFDQPKQEIQKIFALTEDWNIHWCDYPTTSKRIVEQYGVIRLEEWPEGLVLWVGGEIKWKSWEKYYEVGDTGMICESPSGNIYQGLKIVE